MDNLRTIIKLVFKNVSSEEVFLNQYHYDELDSEKMQILANVFVPQYSNNEIINMIQFLKNEFEWHRNKMQEVIYNYRRTTVNVFDAIVLFVDNVLVEENGMPFCKYEHLLRWREMIIELDEDLFISCYLAYKDYIVLYDRKNFFWPPVIGHNNKSLNRLLAQGVAENHFHLKGSAPLFHLSWISLMTNVTNDTFKNELIRFDKRRLKVKVTSSNEYIENSLYTSYLKAAVIRLYLFCVIMEDNFWDKIESIVEILKEKNDIEYFISDIQVLIDCVRYQYADGLLDYTLCRRNLVNNKNNHLNEVISGERWFLYEIYKRIFSGQITKRQSDLFYAYILIKENIRSEMIQGNSNVGFDNFLLYQNRKEYFIENTVFEKVYLKMAVRDTILNQHILKLEARITPKNTAYELKKSIEKTDFAILNSEQDPENLKSKFFYVCHFIKEKDFELDMEKGLSDDIKCRHYAKRNQVKQQALAIFEYRKIYQDKADRLKGIDASSEEIVCRPEVFAQAFRFLKNESVTKTNDSIFDDDLICIPDLKVTYHVGEDFLDVIDGMRAIDEAISYFNMRCGDRLGHALALGVNVKEWYESKGRYILISQMDYLDNLVWFYSKIRKYRISGCEDAIYYIEKKYDEYFRIVYMNNIKEYDLKRVVVKSNEYYNKYNREHTYWNSQCYFSINTYYDSWKLRGDNPELFFDGFFKVKNEGRTLWDEYGVNKIYPENYRIRYNPEAAFLYYTYHYNADVKIEGHKKREIKVNDCIIKAAEKVQKKLQWIVAQKGIAIETNPSSNALIGTFKRYDKHPILSWYNNGLEKDSELIYQVPQLQVSINTDDQGVFATYIENEYAYLALAIEKMKNEDGTPRYSRTVIYDWIDKIREMGLSQSFDEYDSGGEPYE